MLSLKNYLLFFTAFLGISGISADSKITLDVLHTYYLYPIPHAQLGTQKLQTIPQLFDAIQKKGFPSQAAIMAMSNKYNPIWQFKRGIPSNHTVPIFIHSGPYDGVLDRLFNGRTGHGVRCTNSWIRNSLVHGPLVTFDYLFDTKDFDFGQNTNVGCLDEIYTKTAAANPQAPLVILGSCMGSKVALEFAATKKVNRVKAMVLESPYGDIKNVIHNLDTNYLDSVPFVEESDLRDFFEWWFPNGSRAINQSSAPLHTINSGMPILVAHLKNDTVCSDADMFAIIKGLRASGNKNIYLLVIKDPKLSHGRLNNKLEFAQTVNAFFAAHNLPHDAQLAAQGKQFLAQAKTNAHVIDSRSWLLVQNS